MWNSMENMYTDVRINLKKVGPDVTSAGHAAFFSCQLSTRYNGFVNLYLAFSLELTDFKTRRVQQFRKNMVSRHLK